jgi:hypothetical protein
MKNLNLEQLYNLKSKLISNRELSSLKMYNVLDAIKIEESKLTENTSATGGPSAGGGAGAIVSSQPSGLGGQTIGTSWASNGGTSGSGDVAAPYNPSGNNRVFQMVPMGRNHGAMTGKKSREKKIDLKALRNSFNQKKKDDKNGVKDDSKKGKSVMNFNNFLKKEFTTIKK